jgi:hypothetical protein
MLIWTVTIPNWNDRIGGALVTDLITGRHVREPLINSESFSCIGKMPERRTGPNQGANRR